MPANKTLTKEQILKAIDNLEKNPDDKLGILADIGIGAVGAGAAGAAVVAFGGSAVPILFGLIALPVAAPLGMVVGGAALGAAAFVGVKKMMWDNHIAYTQGKQAEMLKQLKEQLREVEAKQRISQLGDVDKTNFIVSLKEPVKLNLINPQDAQALINAVQNGQIPVKDAIKMVKDIIKSAKPE
jgi:hypothetical protein